MIRWTFLFLFMAFVLLLEARTYAEVYHGRVVDTETEGPLEGAVIVVLWFKKPVVTMDGPQYFHKATEVLTDADGKFSIDASPGIDWNPFTYVVEEPWIVIFKPGYGPLTGAYPRGLKNILDELTKGATVRLPKLKTKEEMMRFSSLGSLGIVGLGEKVPRDAIRNLIRLINVQTKSVGLDPYTDR